MAVLHVVIDGSSSPAFADWFERHVVRRIIRHVEKDGTTKIAYMRHWTHLKTPRTLLPHLRDPFRVHRVSMHGHGGRLLRGIVCDDCDGLLKTSIVIDTGRSDDERELRELLDVAAADLKAVDVLLARTGTTGTHSDLSNAVLMDWYCELMPLVVERRIVDAWPPPRIAATIPLRRQVLRLREISLQIDRLFGSFRRSLLFDDPDLLSRPELSEDQRDTLLEAALVAASVTSWSAHLLERIFDISSGHLTGEHRPFAESFREGLWGKTAGDKVFAQVQKQDPQIRLLPMPTTSAELDELDRWAAGLRHWHDPMPAGIEQIRANDSAFLIGLMERRAARRARRKG